MRHLVRFAGLQTTQHNALLKGHDDWTYAYIYIKESSETVQSKCRYGLRYIKDEEQNIRSCTTPPQLLLHIGDLQFA
jgi:hypothetical protein